MGLVFASCCPAHLSLQHGGEGVGRRGEGVVGEEAAANMVHRKSIMHVSPHFFPPGFAPLSSNYFPRLGEPCRTPRRCRTSCGARARLTLLSLSVAWTMSSGRRRTLRTSQLASPLSAVYVPLSWRRRLLMTRDPGGELGGFRSRSHVGFRAPGPWLHLSFRFGCFGVCPGLQAHMVISCHW